MVCIAPGPLVFLAAGAAGHCPLRSWRCCWSWTPPRIRQAVHSFELDACGRRLSLLQSPSSMAVVWDNGIVLRDHGARRRPARHRLQGLDVGANDGTMRAEVDKALACLQRGSHARALRRHGEGASPLLLRVHGTVHACAASVLDDPIRSP
ncbi:hypothetical protein BS78_08G133200 [Paspalum vaginatum]|nr:hypothetical protein BS78_08G133200 [Paspalum vaginatum]